MCEKCKHTPGWITTDEGCKPCTCRKRQPQQIQMKLSDVAAVSIAATDAADRLCHLSDYPRFSDEQEKKARQEVAEALTEMCSSAEQIEWILKRVRQLHTTWKRCGIPGLRQILISKYPARDGIEAGPMCISEAYPEGLPSERDNLTGYQIAAGLALPPAPRSNAGRLLPAASAITPEIAQAYAAPESAGDIPVRTKPPKWNPKDYRPEPKKITQADFDREIERRKQNA